MNTTSSYVYAIHPLDLSTEDDHLYCQLYLELLEDPDFYNYVWAHNAISENAMDVMYALDPPEFMVSKTNLDTIPCMNKDDIMTLYSYLHEILLYENNVYQGHVMSPLIDQFRRVGYMVLVDHASTYWIYTGLPVRK